jgi:hypothetical protein
MRKLTSIVGMGLLTWAMAATGGCGQNDAPDFSTLPLANEAEETDPAGARTFTWVRPAPEQIRCVRAPCPNAFLNDVNLGKTQMSYGYDWRALRLSREEQVALETDAAKLLLYGKYASIQMSGETVQVYQITRANPRVSERSNDRPDFDRYYTVRADPACQQPPCGYTAVLMNVTQTTQWSDIDLSRLGLPADAQQVLLNELQQGKAYLSVQDQSDAKVVATQAFRPHSALPLPNN